MLTLAERFDEKWHLDRRSGCWIWHACKDKAGYGRILVDRVNEKATRVGWRLLCGPIPDGMKVLHKCDVKACVNPDHLYLGTSADNTRDLMAHGNPKWPEARYGEANPAAKLTQKQVGEIRDAIEGGHSQRSIAKRFGVSPETIRFIRLGKTWRDTG